MELDINNSASDRLYREISQLCDDDSDDIEDLRLKLNFTKKMLRNKEETLQVLEGSLKFSRNQVSELTRCYDILQKDRDEKVIEILNLQRTINLQMRTIEDCKANSINDDVFFHKLDMDNEIREHEIDEYRTEIKSLRFDLEVMENLYKVITEEIMKQETTINLLRQACLDRNVEVFDLKVNNEMLVSKLQEKDKIVECQNCKQITKTLNDVNNEWPTLKRNLNVLKKILANENKNDLNIETYLHFNKMESDKVKQRNANLTIKVYNLIKLLFIAKRKVRTNNSKYRRVTNNLRSRIKAIQTKLNTAKCNRKMLQEHINIKNDHISILQREIAKFIEHCREDNDTKETIKLMQIKTIDFEEKLKESYDINKEFKIQLNQMQDMINSLQDKYKAKSDSNSWLEVQLGESSVKGKEMCIRSQEVFECARKLLKQVKEERKCMIKKINKLENVNRLLALKSDYYDDGSNDFYIDN